MSEPRANATSPRILAIIGTRPEATKCVGLVRDVRSARNTFEFLLAFSGQQPDLRRGVIDELRMEPDFLLPDIANPVDLADLTQLLLRQLGALIRECNPDYVAVQGDTATALAGALASAFGAKQLIHLEAGVRSSDPLEPFPEDLNRRLISEMATYHVCFDSAARDNLVREGVERSKIFIAQHPATTYLDEILGDRFVTDVRPIVVVTMHRRERRGERQIAISRVLRRLATRNRSVRFVLVEHPGVDWANETLNLESTGVEIVAPLPPTSFMRFLASTACVITDSAGVVEEASRLGVPCLNFRIVRENRDTGAGLVLSTEDESAIEAAVEAWLGDQPRERSWNRGTESGPSIATQIRQIVLGD